MFQVSDDANAKKGLGFISEFDNVTGRIVKSEGASKADKVLDEIT